MRLFSHIYGSESKKYMRGAACSIRQFEKILELAPPEIGLDRLIIAYK